MLDYLVGAYLQWIDQGADAFRIDTISRVPHPFWNEFTARIRAKHPGFFMFGEAFDYDAQRSPTHTRPGERRRQRARLPAEEAHGRGVRKPGSDFDRLLEALYLDDGAVPRIRTSS